MAYSRQRGEMDSAEWAVVIGGFSLFAIGLLSVLVIVVVNRRPATVIAAAPVQQPTATAPVVSPPPSTASQSAYAPPPPISAAPPALSKSTDEPESNFPADESEESQDEEQQPSTITLQAPWPDDPGEKPGDTGAIGGESMGARLAREAQERAQAAREAREAERRARDEERRRRAEGSQGGGQSYSPPPPPPSHIPQPPIISRRPPQWGPHGVTGPEATSATDQEEEYVVTQYSPAEENRRPFRRSRFAAAVGLLVTGLHLLYSSLLNPQGLKGGRVTGLLVSALGSSGARLVCLFGGVIAIAFGAFVLYLNLQMLGVV